MMELIERNKETIINWYYKGAKKDKIINLVLPPDFNLDCLVKTKWVKPEIVNEVAEMNFGIAPPQKLKIYPLMMRNHCHYNCSKLCQIMNKNEERLRHLVGYNFCSCPCGKFYSLEIHSVVQDIATGEMIDITQDFGNETEKWFVPVREVDRTEMSGSYYLKVIGNAKRFLGCEFYYNCDTEHSCRLPNGKEIDWIPPKDTTYKGNKTDFIEAVESLKNVRFY